MQKRGRIGETKIIIRRKVPEESVRRVLAYVCEL